MFRILKVWLCFIALRANAEISLTELEDKLAKNFIPNRSLQEDLELDEYSLVSEEELKAFLLFSADKAEINEKLTSLKLKKILTAMGEGDLLEISKKLVLKNLIENNCKEVYCFQHYISFDYIPQVFWKGLIGIEDKRYLDHKGVDWRSVARAFVANVKRGKFEQGGSTISQQLVKNLFLTNEKTISRKVKEVYSTLYLESKISKEKILEAYLNEVTWGAVQGIRVKGVYAASLFYLGKRPDEVTPFEGAMLISMLKGPAYYSPLKHLERLKERTKTVYEVLKEDKLIPTHSNLEWKEAEWNKFKKRMEALDKSRPYLAIWKTLNDKEISLKNYEKFVLISKIQNLRNELNIDGISVKVLLGDVLKSDWYSYYSRVERNKEKAFKEESHQVGSTIKPLLFHLFLKNGMSMADLVSTESITLKLKSQNWTPKEAHVSHETEVTLQTALQQSLNRPIVHLAKKIGFEPIEADLKKYIPKIPTPLSEYPATLLGSVELTIHELKDAYLKFINDECVSTTEDGSENLKKAQVLEALSDPTQTTVKSSVKGVMQKLKFFGKTGTTNKGFDNWFVAFDGKNLTIIWVGYEDDRGSKGLGLYGSTTAFKIFQNYYRDRGKRFQKFGCDLVN